MQTKFSINKKQAIVIFALIVFCANSFYAQISVKERIEIFEEVWGTINEKYYDASFNGVSWAAIKRKYKNQLAKVGSDDKFYELLDQMAGELRDSHTRVYSPAQREERKKQRRTSIGVSIKEIENVPVVYSVAPDSEAAQIGVKAGMIVLSVNDRPIAEAVNEARRAINVSSSRRSTQMRVFSKIFAGEPDSQLKIELKDADGKSRKFILTRRSISAPPQIFTKILPSKIAYLKFNQFNESIEKQIEESLEKFKDAPALILDLRGNGGGDGEMGLRFAGKFFDDKITVAKIVTRTGKPPIPKMPMTLETGNKDGQIFSRPIAILINEGTASTAELITNALQEQNRAKIFGTNSCGCVLAFLDYKPIKGGGELTLSEFGFITPKGKTLEGKGVTPDKIIPITIKDIQNERDAALEEAESYLLKISK